MVIGKSYSLQVRFDNVKLGDTLNLLGLKFA